MTLHCFAIRIAKVKLEGKKRSSRRRLLCLLIWLSFCVGLWVWIPDEWVPHWGNRSAHISGKKQIIRTLLQFGKPGSDYIELVPLTGLEPVRLLQQGILSPWCLPIPPQRQVALFYHDLPLPSSRSEAKGKVFWGRITTQRPMHGKGLFAGAAEPSGFCTQGGNDATGSLYIAQKIQHHQFSVFPSHCG